MAKLEDIIKSYIPRLSEDYTPGLTPCTFITGAAGTGKTFSIKKKIEEDPSYGLLCATTGIAAVNLGATTLNSLLKFFDTDSLRDRFNRGGLTSTIHSIGKKVRNLIIDEVSMMDARQLDYIYMACEACNEFQDMQGRPIGIVLTGDFAQLPPIKANWVFMAECWEHFERNTTTLEKVWRQDNLKFLEAINHARSGRGKECAAILKDLGVKFVSQAEKSFDGTTIMSKNDQVDNFNYSALLDLPGEFFGLRAAYWGHEDSSWKKNIPEVLKLKMGAYVMILNNDSPFFSYVNGDCGHIVGRSPEGGLSIKLVRNGNTVRIGPIVRSATCTMDEGKKMGLGDPFQESSYQQTQITPLGLMKPFMKTSSATKTASTKSRVKPTSGAPRRLIVRGALGILEGLSFILSVLPTQVLATRPRA